MCLTNGWSYVAPKTAWGKAQRGSIAPVLCDRSFMGSFLGLRAMHMAHETESRADRSLQAASAHTPESSVEVA